MISLPLLWYCKVDFVVMHDGEDCWGCFNKEAGVVLVVLIMALPLRDKHKRNAALMAIKVFRLLSCSLNQDFHLCMVLEIVGVVSVWEKGFPSLNMWHMSVYTLVLFHVSSFNHIKCLLFNPRNSTVFLAALINLSFCWGKCAGVTWEDYLEGLWRLGSWALGMLWRRGRWDGRWRRCS
jgi:hypothetical protein